MEITHQDIHWMSWCMRKGYGGRVILPPFVVLRRCCRLQLKVGDVGRETATAASWRMRGRKQTEVMHQRHPADVLVHEKKGIQAAVVADDGRGWWCVGGRQV